MLTTVLAAATIFLLRCVDVSLGTLRMILTIQDRRTLSSVIGFIEVTVFITAVATVVQGPLDAVRIFAYGAGFAAGTYLGMTIERKLRLGASIVRVITRRHEVLVRKLVASGFGVTLVEGRGGRGTVVGIVFSVVRRRRLQEHLNLVRSVDPNAAVSVEDVRQAVQGYFTSKRPAPAVAGR